MLCCCGDTYIGYVLELLIHCYILYLFVTQTKDSLARLSLWCVAGQNNLNGGWMFFALIWCCLIANELPDGSLKNAWSSKDWNVLNGKGRGTVSLDERDTLRSLKSKTTRSQTVWSVVKEEACYCCINFVICVTISWPCISDIFFFSHQHTSFTDKKPRLTTQIEQKRQGWLATFLWSRVVVLMPTWGDDRIWQTVHGSEIPNNHLGCMFHPVNKVNYRSLNWWDLAGFLVAILPVFLGFETITDFWRTSEVLPGVVGCSTWDSWRFFQCLKGRSLRRAAELLCMLVRLQLACTETPIGFVSPFHLKIFIFH